MAGRHRSGSGRRGRLLRRALAVAVPSLGVVALAAAVVVGGLTSDRGAGRTVDPDAAGPDVPGGQDRPRALTPAPPADRAPGSQAPGSQVLPPPPGPITAGLDDRADRGSTPGPDACSSDAGPSGRSGPAQQSRAAGHDARAGTTGTRSSPASTPAGSGTSGGSGHAARPVAAPRVPAPRTAPEQDRSARRTVPADLGPTGTGPAATEPAATRPAGSEPSATEPSATEPSAAAPTGTAPSQRADRPGRHVREEPEQSGDSLLRLRLRLEQDRASEADVRVAGPALSLLGR